MRTTKSRLCSMVAAFVSILLAVVLVAVVMCTGCRANAFDAASPAWVQVPVDSAKMSALQAEVDDGHRVGFLDPVDVVLTFLTQDLALSASKVGGVQLQEAAEWAVRRYCCEPSRRTYCDPACAGAACPYRFNRYLVCSEVPLCEVKLM